MVGSLNKYLYSGAQQPTITSRLEDDLGRIRVSHQNNFCQILFDKVSRINNEVVVQRKYYSDVFRNQKRGVATLTSDIDTTHSSLGMIRSDRFHIHGLGYP